MSYPIQCNVSKCCPTDSVIKTSNELSCESISNRTVAWDAHNVLPSSIPNCSTVHNVFNKNETSVGLNGCLDRNTNNQFVAVSCSTDPNTSVHLMNKCCPTGLSYDHSERQCKQNLNSNEHFKSLFGDSAVVFKNEVPNCAEAEVFVEYFSTIHSIRFEGMLLKVDDETFLSEKFCIDDLVNINSVKASEQHVIVRICRPRSVCDKIPCMRRCCKVDQIIEPQPEGNKVCQFHPSKINLLPIFHNVSLPLNSPEQAYPKGTNQKYILPSFSTMSLELHFSCVSVQFVIVARTNALINRYTPTVPVEFNSVISIIISIAFTDKQIFEKKSTLFINHI